VQVAKNLVILSSASGLRGELYISESTSAKWIFDVKIERLRAEVMFLFEKTKLCLKFLTLY
jgi:hypothetical protein